jgi:CheY-like chemotaxis protein
MPNLDGLQSTRLIREIGFTCPIVALTAFAEESNFRECGSSPYAMALPALLMMIGSHRHKFGHELFPGQTHPAGCVESDPQDILPHHTGRIKVEKLALAVLPAPVLVLVSLTLVPLSSLLPQTHTPSLDIRLGLVDRREPPNPPLCTL